MGDRWFFGTSISGRRLVSSSGSWLKCSHFVIGNNVAHHYNCPNNGAKSKPLAFLGFSTLASCRQSSWFLDDLARLSLGPPHQSPITNHQTTNEVEDTVRSIRFHGFLPQ